MADNSILAPFTNLVTGQGNPPMNQQTQDLNKHIIEQMTGRYQADHMPNPGGPYGWMGAASDATKMFTTPMLLNAYRKAQEQIGQQGKTGAQEALFNQEPPSSAGGGPSAPPGATPAPAVPEAPNMQPTGQSGGPLSFKDQVKMSENENLALGKSKSSTASWDFKQYTNGFGTKALTPNETIDAPTSHARFDAEWNKAAQLVATFPNAQNLDPGTKAALTSLTFNSGTKWMSSGLGQAVQQGDIEKARQLFLQYNHAGGKVNPTLDSRRSREATWFGQQDPGEQQATIDPTGRSNAGAPVPPELPPTGSTTPVPGAPPAAAAAQPDAQPGTEETPPGANPVRMAQNTGQPGSPNSFAGPGNGVAMPNLENSKQFGDMFMGLYRMGMPVDKIMDYINDYRKRSATELHPGPLGSVPITNRPQDQGGPVMGQPMPQLGERQFPHISIHGIQVPLMPYGTNAKGEPVFKSAVGDVGGGDTPKTISEWAEFGRQQQALDTGVSKNADAMAEMRNKIQDEGSGLNAGATNVEIQKMLSLSKTFNPERGPTAAWTTKVREFISNMRSEEQEQFGLTPDYVRRATANELAQKFQTYLSFAMAKTLNTNRVTNLSLQEALQANPNAMQTKEGMESLLDLLGQDMQRKMGLAKEVGQLPISRNNEIPEISRKYMASHPAIYRDKEKGDLYMKDYEGAEDEAAKLPVGSRFTYKGQIMRVKPKEDTTKRGQFKPIPGVTP